MRRLAGPAVLLAAFVVQLTLSAAWPGSVVFFDLPLLVVVYYALNRGPTVGLVLGGAVGLLQDGLTGSLLGAAALSKSLVGFLAGVGLFVLAAYLLSGEQQSRLAPVSGVAVLQEHKQHVHNKR